MSKTGNIFSIVFSEVVSEPELTEWIEESEKELAAMNGEEYYVYADLRNVKPLTADAAKLLEKGQVMFRNSGMVRSVVVLADAITAMQFKRVAKESGIDKWERYIDASENPNYRQAGMSWLLSAKEPE